MPILAWNTLYTLFNHLHVTRLEKQLLVQFSKESPNERSVIRRVKCAGEREKKKSERIYAAKRSESVTGAVVRGLYRQPLPTLYTIALLSPFLGVDALSILSNRFSPAFLASLYPLKPWDDVWLNDFVTTYRHRLVAVNTFPGKFEQIFDKTIATDNTVFNNTHNTLRYWWFMSKKLSRSCHRHLF